MHGSQASNMAVDACDLLIAVGCRFSDRVALNPASFARNAKVVQIDIDRSEINKNVETAHHIIGDAKRVLQLLNERLEQLDHTPWKDYVFSFKTVTEYDEADDRLTPGQVLDAIARIAPRDAIFTTDVGQHQMWALQHLHFEYSGQLVTSGGFGTMGFGLGAAIGAQVGNPDKLVLHITGDGSFRMNCNELATEQYYDIPPGDGRDPAGGGAARGHRRGSRHGDRLRHRHRRDGAPDGVRRRPHHRVHGGLGRGVRHE